jgi:hypothetical protein
MVRDDAASGLGADLDAKHITVATEPITLAKEWIVDEFAVHDPRSLVDQRATYHQVYS